ncbi:MAG: AAA family ATPase [Candidatus Bathyarchaeota archaeon]|nr:AAA family ATPase [Candidatus Bathyarchaeota archaeon]
MSEKLQTGIKCVDNTLEGGISPQSITLIYGEPETGKSTLAMQVAFYCALQNRKVLYVDCDNTFAAQRLMQISGDKFEEIAPLILLVKPLDFKEQTAVVDHISDYTEKNFGLIVIDTFTSLYGAKVAEYDKKTFSINRELNRQLAILAQSVKVRKIPVIITSQVRNVFAGETVSIAPVANRVLKFWADTIIDLKPTENTRLIKAVIEKSLKPVQSTCYIQIGENGISDASNQ